MFGFAAFVCTVFTAVALLRKEVVPACVGALGVGTAGLLWFGNPPSVAIGTGWWVTILVATATTFLLSYFGRTRTAGVLALHLLLTGFVLWLGTGAIGTIILLAIAAIAVVASGLTVKRHRAWRAAVIAAVIVGFGTTAIPSFSGTAVAADAGDTKYLAIKPGDLLPDVAKCDNGDTFNRNSMPETAGRKWKDSDSTPFIATSSSGRFTELTREICVNPVLGDAYIQALTDAQIGSFSVAQANPWMGEFLDKSNGTTGLKVWVAHKTSDPKGFYVTDDYQKNYAQLVNAVLYVLDNQGTKTATSTVNWPLGGLVADALPRVFKEARPNKQESEPFMALTFTQKGGVCPYVLGVNVEDKRPENFPCEVAKKVAPPTPTPHKPPVVPPTHTTPTPTTPGHTPTPTTTPSKPPKACPPGQTGTPPNCLEIKDPTPIPTNEHHTPAGHPTEPASQPSHPAQTANPSTKPGSGSTQTAPGATAAPKPTKSVPPPEVTNDPTSPATGCVNPVTGDPC